MGRYLRSKDKKEYKQEMDPGLREWFERSQVFVLSSPFGFLVADQAWTRHWDRGQIARVQLSNARTAQSALQMCKKLIQIHRRTYAKLFCPRPPRHCSLWGCRWRRRSLCGSSCSMRDPKTLASPFRVCLWKVCDSRTRNWTEDTKGQKAPHRCNKGSKCPAGRSWSPAVKEAKSLDCHFQC